MVSAPAERHQHIAVIRSERTGSLHDRSSASPLQVPSAGLQLILKLTSRKMPPSTVRHPVASDLHAAFHHFPDLGAAHEKRLIETAGTNEEFRAKSTPQQRRKNMSKIRIVTIIHRDADMWMVFDKIENRIKKIRIKPAIGLALVHRTRNGADAVEVENQPDASFRVNQACSTSPGRFTDDAPMNRRSLAICSFRMYSITGLRHDSFAVLKPRH